jgi:hypothetical protein
VMDMSEANRTKLKNNKRWKKYIIRWKEG